MINFTPRAWQLKAFNAWVESACKGTVQAATGSGKTAVGMMAINSITGTVLIVVPTVALQKQWFDELVDCFPSLQSDIGLVGSGHNDFSRRVTITVVNSVRGCELQAELLIMDEIHRYGSVENIKFLQNGTFNKILGITATLQREDDRDKLLIQHADVVYDYSQADAIGDGHLCKYNIINMAVALKESEREKYEQYQSVVRALFPQFKNDYRMMIRNQQLAAARSCRVAMQQRRELLFSCENKISVAVDLLTRMNNSKAFVFGEYINVCNKVHQELLNAGITSAVYHSKMKAVDRKRMLEEFHNDKLRVVVTVKALEEGVDVPSADVAIILAGSHVKRQMIQRLGRILRNQPSKVATVYQLFAEDTVERRWVAERVREFRNVAKSIQWR